ncbi:choline transporter-like, partial [Kipferlia bialata]
IYTHIHTLNVIGDSFLFAGKLFIAILSGSSIGVAIFYLADEGLQAYWMLPSILVALFAFVFASMLMSVVEVVIDTGTV